MVEQPHYVGLSLSVSVCGTNNYTRPMNGSTTYYDRVVIFNFNMKSLKCLFWTVLPYSSFVLHNLLRLSCVKMVRFVPGLFAELANITFELFVGFS